MTQRLGLVRVPQISRATRGAGVALWRYIAALDAEESAAEVYASLVRRVGRVVTSDGDRSGPLAA